MTMRALTGAIGLVFLSACAANPATPEQRRLAERRLLEPFLVGREVGCAELLVELTANFDAQVGAPAVDRTRHTVSTEPGDGFVDTVWTNTAGVADAAFLVAVGDGRQLTDTGWVAGKQTTFRVVNQVRRRVYSGRRELTLNAIAGGGFVFVKDAATAPREVKQFAIADGVLQR